MINGERFGLVIQGPLTSKFTKDPSHNYDCNKAINEILNKYSHLFSKIILSTWKSEVNKIKLENKFTDKITFLYLDDPGRPKLFSNEESDNRLRQFYSSFYGLKNFKTDEIDYAVRLRTDLIVDCEKAINYFLKELNRKKLLNKEFKGLICATEFWINRPYALKDFIYIGTLKELREFFYAQILLKRYRFSYNVDNWPERDSILKYLYLKKVFFRDPNLQKFELNSFFPFIPKKIHKSFQVFQYEDFKLWQYSILNYFSIIPYEVAKTIEWKGIKYLDFPKGLFEGDSHKTFVKAEQNLLSLIKDYEKEKGSFVILRKKKLITFNPLFHKRKLEIKKKKTIFRTLLFTLLIKFFICIRKIHFYYIKKLIIFKIKQKLIITK